MDKNTPLTFGVFEDYFTKYMDSFRDHLDVRFDTLETKMKQHVSEKIDELALATKMGFDHVDERFDLLEEQIDDLAFATKTGFDDMDRQFTDVKIEIRMLQGDMTDAKKYIQSSGVESSSNRVRLQNLEAHIA